MQTQPWGWRKMGISHGNGGMQTCLGVDTDAATWIKGHQRQGEGMVAAGQG